MKAKRLLEKIAENWPAKVVCFVMALLLYILHQVSQLDRKTFTVPLNVVAEGGMYPMSQCPDYVKVTVRSTAGNIAEAIQSDISANLDLTTYDVEGAYAVPVTVKLSPKLILMDPFEVTVKPESVNVKIEEKTMKYVKVEPAVSGEPLHGYTVKTSAVTPETVQVIGPRSIVDNTKQIYTDKIDISGLAGTKTWDVPLQNINSLLIVQSDDSQKFHVELDAEPEMLVRNFTNVPIKTVFLNPKFQITSKLPDISFDLQGTVTLLEDYEIDDTSVEIDCSSVHDTGDYELPVKFTLPSYLTVADKSFETVKVTVGNYTDADSQTDVGTVQ